MSSQTTSYDIIVIGAGAAGLFAAITAGQRGRKVLVLDHANKAGKKILMSGGGRCNFTNKYTSPDNYLSHNPHFCKSALSKYTPWHFIELVERYAIPYHEKAHGQLFCDHKSKDIVDLLLAEAAQANVVIQLNVTIDVLETTIKGYSITTNQHQYHCASLIVATGGLSIPTMGASPLGYQLAEQFGLKIHPTRAALVPFTLHQQDKQRFANISGISVPCRVTCQEMTFTEDCLFTHRGMSGPAMLQISSFWQPGETLDIQLQPDVDILLILQQAKRDSPNKKLNSVLQYYFPKRLVELFVEASLLNESMQTIRNQQMVTIANVFSAWQLKPNNTEGYRTAEVTLGGIDVNQLSSKTFECNCQSGLYFIGEVLDVTGWLGGYNFQWAWSSGYAAGSHA